VIRKGNGGHRDLIYTVNPAPAINLSNRPAVFNVFLETGEMALAVAGYQKKVCWQNGQIVYRFKYRTIS